MNIGTFKGVMVIFRFFMKFLKKLICYSYYVIHIMIIFGVIYFKPRLVNFIVLEIFKIQVRFLVEFLSHTKHVEKIKGETWQHRAFANIGAKISGWNSYVRSYVHI